MHRLIRRWLTCHLIVAVLVVAAAQPSQTLGASAQMPRVSVSSAYCGPGGANNGSPPYGVPSGCAYGLQSILGVVQSAYTYEAALLGGMTPVADSDYILPYAARETITLPGNKSNHYFYYGCIYVDGSGFIEEFGAPHGDGRFALLHLSACWLANPGGSIPHIKPPHFLPGMDDAERTAYAIEAMGLTRASRIRSVPGGAAIGTTGWPTSPVYGNGLAGPQNAQLCVVSSWAARDWFWKVAQGQNSKPHRFPMRAWNAYRDGHHLKRIPPRYHGHLSLAASWWWKIGVRRCHGVKGHEVWHRKGRYMTTPFSHCVLETWPNHPKWRAALR